MKDPNTVGTPKPMSLEFNKRFRSLHGIGTENDQFISVYEIALDINATPSLFNAKLLSSFLSHVMTSLSGKDRDTDFAGSRNPCAGFRGRRQGVGKRLVQLGYTESCRARQVSKALNNRGCRKQS